MTLIEQIKNNLKIAMKEKRELELSVVRSLISAIKNEAIANKKPETELTDLEIIKVLKKEAKKRKDAIIGFTQGGRAESAQVEEKELAIIDSYLPAEMDEDALKAVIDQVIAQAGLIAPSDFGKIMKEVIAKTNGQADGKLVSQLVKEKINNKQ